MQLRAQIPIITGVISKRISIKASCKVINPMSILISGSFWVIKVVPWQSGDVLRLIIKPHRTCFNLALTSIILVSQMLVVHILKLHWGGACFLDSTSFVEIYFEVRGVVTVTIRICFWQQMHLFLLIVAVKISKWTPLFFFKPKTILSQKQKVKNTTKSTTSSFLLKTTYKLLLLLLLLLLESMAFL